MSEGAHEGFEDTLRVVSLPAYGDGKYTVDIGRGYSSLSDKVAASPGFGLEGDAREAFLGKDIRSLSGVLFLSENSGNGMTLASNAEECWGSGRLAWHSLPDRLELSGPVQCPAPG